MFRKKFDLKDLHTARVMLAIPWDQVSLVRVATGCAEKLSVQLPRSRKMMKQVVSDFVAQNPSTACAARGELHRKKAGRNQPSTRTPIRHHAPIGKPHPDYVRNDGFYTSRAWREVRYFALVQAGGLCQCCGAQGAKDARLHVDHIIPRYKEPERSLDPDNLQVLCEDCNMGKGAWDSTDWRQHMKSIAEA